MSVDARKSDEFLWDIGSVSFSVVHHGLEDGALLVVLCWISVIYAGVPE